MLYFDVVGRLSYNHGCEGCDKYPLEDPSEPCILCGYSQDDIGSVYSQVEAMNEAYDKYGQNFEDKPKSKSRSAFLHVSHICLGGEYDTMTLTDVDMDGDIRKLADLTEHMVELVIVPTDIVHKGLYNDDDYEDDY